MSDQCCARCKEKVQMDAPVLHFINLGGELQPVCARCETVLEWYKKTYLGRGLGRGYTHPSQVEIAFEAWDRLHKAIDETVENIRALWHHYPDSSIDVIVRRFKNTHFVNNKSQRPSLPSNKS